MKILKFSESNLGVYVCNTNKIKKNKTVFVLFKKASANVSGNRYTSKPSHTYTHIHALAGFSITADELFAPLLVGSRNLYSSSNIL